MPNIPDAALNEMLKQLPKETRKSLAHLVSGKISHQVHCMSEACNGEVIAYLYVDGVDIGGRPAFRVEPVVKEDKSMKLLIRRKRLDGEFGFRCVCGNDSQLAPQEKGIIGSNQPTRADLEVVYRKLQANPSNYPEIDGIKEVDGFKIERVNV